MIGFWVDFRMQIYTHRGGYSKFLCVSYPISPVGGKKISKGLTKWQSGLTKWQSSIQKLGHPIGVPQHYTS